MMKWLGRFIATLMSAALLLACGLVVLAALLFSQNSSVPAKAPATAAQAQVAKATLLQLKRVLFQQQNLVLLSQPELDALAPLASRVVKGLRGEVRLAQNRVGVKASWEVPYIGRYINLQLEIGQGRQHAELTKLQIGELKLSPKFGLWLADKLWRHFHGGDIPNPARLALESIHIEYSTLFIHSAPLDHLMALSESYQSLAKQVFTLPDSDKLNRIQFMLAEVCQGLPATQKLSLAVIQHQLMERLLPQVNSAEADAWGRALVWGLAIELANPKFARLLPKRRSHIVRTELREQVVLAGRRDLALHFLYSAILEQLGGESASFALGELKELNDSAKGGSGFSFADLAADRAGIAYSRHLTQQQTALSGLTQLASDGNEQTFFPAIQGLQEQLPESRFVQEYGSVGSTRYQVALEQMDLVIQALPLYQPANLSPQN